MKRTISRICGDGMLLAMYIVLSTLTVRLTPNLQIAFTGLTIIMAVVLYGLPDAILIAVLGSFIGQARGAYGLSITTPLWMVPPILRAVVFGIAYEIFLKKGIKLEDKKVLFIVFAIIAGLVTTIANTGAIFLDAMIFEYPVSMAVVESIFRFVSSILSSIFIALVTLPIIYALKNANLIHDRISNKTITQKLK
ncbi:MAG: ECF transporter S component [Bacilli bacterium]|nr:ECF transporter S component [Bacilli bacterium]